MTSLQSSFAQIYKQAQQALTGFVAKLPALARLTRIDKPIGIYLLLWPTISSLWIAAQGFPDLDLLIIFILGTVVMRSAGCAINDFADFEIDGKVERTVSRPLAAQELKRQDALYCFLVLSVLGFGLVLLTNIFTILLSIAAVIVAALYPFVKRVSNLPQVVLGIAFSCGILMAFSAQTGELANSVFLLFVANIVWTVAYDTQYAMVDREYDIEIGVKSTAILFGDADRLVIGVLQAMFIIAMWLAGQQFELGFWYFLSLIGSCGLFLYQQYLIQHQQPAACFKAFLNNNWIGALIFVGVVLSFI